MSLDYYYHYYNQWLTNKEESATSEVRPEPSAIDKKDITLQIIYCGNFWSFLAHFDCKVKKVLSMQRGCFYKVSIEFTQDFTL